MLTVVIVKMRYKEQMDNTQHKQDTLSFEVGILTGFEVLRRSGTIGNDNVSEN